MFCYDDRVIRRVEDRASLALFLQPALHQIHPWLSPVRLLLRHFHFKRWLDVYYKTFTRCLPCAPAKNFSLGHHTIVRRLRCIGSVPFASLFQRCLHSLYGHTPIFSIRSPSTIMYPGLLSINMMTELGMFTAIDLKSLSFRRRIY